MPVFRRTNFIITASGIVTLCKRLYSMPDESRLQSSLLSSGILYGTVQRVTIIIKHAVSRNRGSIRLINLVLDQVQSIDIK